MTDKERFFLDANVFIEAARRYYAFDLAPGFWRSLVALASDGRIASVDRVRKELEKGKDELATWAKSDFSDAFEPTTDSNVIQEFVRIMRWVQAQDQFLDAAKALFAAGADGWLIAHAKVKGGVVVTHEAFSAEVKKKVPIPNVCKAFGVEFIDTFEMLRRLGVKLA